MAANDKTVRLPNCYAFPYFARHQTKTIQPGKSGVIYKYEVPQGRVAFVDMVANVWYEDTYYYWMIDYYLVEKVQREISPMNDPLHIARPYVAQYEISWEAHNDSDTALTFEVLHDGSIYDKPKNMK